MARRVEKQAAKAPSASHKDADASLGTLHPEITLPIAGRDVTVREYGFVEGLRLLVLARSFLDALYALVAQADAAPSLHQVEAAIAEHIDTVRQLMAVSAGVDVDWIDGLSEQDGDLLLMTWWQVNGGFFIRRVLRKAASEKLARLSAGRASTPPSSALDTEEAPTTSDG